MLFRCGGGGSSSGGGGDCIRGSGSSRDCILVVESRAGWSYCISGGRSIVVVIGVVAFVLVNSILEIVE